MTQNLISPFILREAGLIVNDISKIHNANPTQDTKIIQDQQSGLVIDLETCGILCSNIEIQTNPFG